MESIEIGIGLVTYFYYCIKCSIRLRCDLPKLKFYSKRGSSSHGAETLGYFFQLLKCDISIIVFFCHPTNCPLGGFFLFGSIFYLSLVDFKYISTVFAKMKFEVKISISTSLYSSLNRNPIWPVQKWNYCRLKRIFFVKNLDLGVPIWNLIRLLYISNVRNPPIRSLILISRFLSSQGQINFTHLKLFFDLLWAK